LQPALKQLTSIYLNVFVFVYALYAYFNKGVAYAFMAEIMLVIGLALILFNLKNYVFIWNKPIKLVAFFISITGIWFLFGLSRYPLVELLQDAFMFFYAFFIFIVFLFIGEFERFKEKIFTLYKWYPLVVFCTFFLVSYIPFFQTFKLFGDIPLLLYKYGDMAIHLLITSLLLICGHIKMSKRFLALNVIVISYLFLVIAAYNRAGMLSYAAGMFLFLFVYRKKFSAAAISSYMKVIPFVLLIVLAFYVNTKVDENFQGRTVGIEQLKQNITSIFSTDVEGSLSDNKVWRLAWWYKIIVDATSPKNALVGKGVGENLALINDIKVENEGLRSPHNFHLNILARFGFVFLFIWFWWIGMHMKNIRASNDSEFNVMALVIIMAFLVNASFDVYLEGPMGAFPFWTWLGILYINDSEVISI
jgi:hypothetical protein